MHDGSSARQVNRAHFQIVETQTSNSLCPHINATQTYITDADVALGYLGIKFLMISPGNRWQFKAQLTIGKHTEMQRLQLAVPDIDIEIDVLSHQPIQVCTVAAGTGNYFVCIQLKADFPC